MIDPPGQPSSIALAMEWVARITTVALEMVLPGLAGQWLDQRFGTRFLVLIGSAFGMTTGFWHLLSMTGAAKRRTGRPSGKSANGSAGDSPNKKSR